MKKTGGDGHVVGPVIDLKEEKAKKESLKKAQEANKEK